MPETVQIPARIGYAGGNLRGLYDTLVALRDRITEGGLNEQEVQALIDAAIAEIEVTAANVAVVDTGENYTAEDVEGVLSEIAGVLSGKYEKPELGIPAEDLVEAVQNALAAAETAYQKPETGIPQSDLSASVQGLLNSIAPRSGIVALAGANPTPVAFGEGTPASALSDAGPFALADGDTLKITINGGTQRTVTFAGTRGYHLGGEGGRSDLTSETDKRIKVGIDGADPVEVEFNWTGCNKAVLIAAQMETVIAGQFTGAQAICSPETFELDTGTANGGTFALLRNGETITGCGEIAYNADAATVQTLLRTEYGADKVSVAKDGTTFTIVFTEAFHKLHGHSGLGADLNALTYPNGADASFTQVDAATFKYLIVSPSKGTGSSVVVARADSLDVCDELDIGPGNGTSTDGTGDAVNLGAATAEEVATKLVAILVTQYAEPVTIEATENDEVSIVTSTTGAASRIEFDDTSTAALGLTSADDDQGANGLGYSTGMANTSYIVLCQIEGAADPDAVSLSVGNKTVNGFDIYCDTATATNNVAIVVFGQAAEA